MTIVGILGVIHDTELRNKYNLSLEYIQQLITEFNPDVICGEVLPNSWEKYKEDKHDRGYWGEPASEYWDLIFPLCEEHGILFEPIDWVELDVWLDFDPFSSLDEHLKTKCMMELDTWFEKQLAMSDSGVIPFNSMEFDMVTEQKYEWLEQINPQSHMLRWECRHLIMVQRIRNAIKMHQGRRILCIAGADHNHVLYEQLRVEQGIEVVYPLRK